MKKILFAAMLTVVFAVPAFSQMMDMPMGGGMEGHEHMMEMGAMDRMGNMMGMCLDHANKVGLTDDQIKKLTPIHRAMQKVHVRFKADLKIAEIELLEIMDVKDFDIEKASAVVRKIADLKTAHHLEMLKSMKEVRAILTDEQFRKMKKLMPMKMDAKKPAKKMKRQK